MLIEYFRSIKYKLGVSAISFCLPQIKMIIITRNHIEYLKMKFKRHYFIYIPYSLFDWTKITFDAYMTSVDTRGSLPKI